MLYIVDLFCKKIENTIEQNEADWLRWVEKALTIDSTIILDKSKSLMYQGKVKFIVFIIYIRR